MAINDLTQINLLVIAFQKCIILLSPECPFVRKGPYYLKYPLISPNYPLIDINDPPKLTHLSIAFKKGIILVGSGYCGVLCATWGIFFLAKYMVDPIWGVKISFFTCSGGFLRKKWGMKKIKVVHICHGHLHEDAGSLILTSPHYGPPLLILMLFIWFQQELSKLTTSISY